MSDKPEKIWLIQMDDYNLVWSDCPDPTNGDTIPGEDRTEYIRADKANEIIEAQKSIIMQYQRDLLATP